MRLHCTSHTVAHALQVLPVGPEEVVAGEWTNECLLLVMPGGADLPYCRQLNGPGTASIHGDCALLCLWSIAFSSSSPSMT